MEDRKQFGVDHVRLRAILIMSIHGGDCEDAIIFSKKNWSPLGRNHFLLRIQNKWMLSWFLSVYMHEKTFILPTHLPIPSPTVASTEAIVLEPLLPYCTYVENEVFCLIPCPFRKQFLRQRRCAVLIQTAWRGYCCRKNFKMVRNMHSSLRCNGFCIAMSRADIILPDWIGFIQIPAMSSDAHWHYK